MRRAVFSAFGLILMTGAAFAGPAGSGDDELKLLQSGVERVQAQDCAGALPILKSVVDAPAFSQLDDNRQYLANRLLAACANDLGDYKTAAKPSRQTTKMPYADQVDWYVRTIASYATGDKQDAGVALEVLADKWPDAVHHINLRALFVIVDAAAGTPEGDARNFRTLRSLFALDWRPRDESPDHADSLWIRLARYQMQAGDIAAARKTAAVIVSPEISVIVQSEKVFDPLFAGDPARYDILKSYEAAAVRLKASAAAAPDKIEPVVELTMVLYQLDRQAEALALIDGTLAKVKAGKHFADQDDQLNWLYDRRSNVLMALGRVDEAIDAMRNGSGYGESGTNVSQTINLADLYFSAGRPAEAIKTLAGFDPKNASPYGVMAAEEARACSFAQLGDRAGLAKSLDYIRAHAGDAPTLVVGAVLCGGEESEAAALTVKYLNDPQLREKMLNHLHGSKKPALEPDLPFGKLMRARWAALGKRPEVVRAAASFGRILELPLVSY